MVCLRCFILFSILFQCNTPLVLTSPSLLQIATTSRRSANGLFESFILFSLLFLTQCALDPHQFPSSSSSVAIRRQNTSHGAGRGGGGEEGWERFALDADLQSEGEEEEEDMHVLQSDAGAGGRGRGWGSPGGRATSAGWS